MNVITEEQTKRLKNMATCSVGFGRDFAKNVLKQGGMSVRQELLLRKLEKQLYGGGSAGQCYGSNEATNSYY